MKKILLLLCFFAAPAMADESIPLLYSRTNIVIQRGNLAPVAPALPWQKPVQPDPNLTLDVEVRDATSFYRQQGWYSLSSPPDNSGVLLAFSAPTLAAIGYATQYSPLDILMVDKEGRITQIAPNLVLAELNEEIYAKSPVLALLLLKGGSCARHTILPGDSVNYKIFKKPPAVLSVPDGAPAPEAAVEKPVEIMTEPKGKKPGVAEVFGQ